MGMRVKMLTGDGVNDAARAAAATAVRQIARR